MLVVPKRLGGKGGLTPSHARSKTQEKATAARLGGKTTPRSGAGRFVKGDVRVEGLLRVEAKTTKHASFSVTKALIEQIEGQALAAGELPVIEVEIEGGARRVYVMPTWALDGLVSELQRLQRENKDGAAS